MPERDVTMNAGFETRAECPLCGGTERALVFDFATSPIVKCASCRFTYSERIFTTEERLRYYTKNFGGERYVEGQQVNARVNAIAIERLLPMDRIHDSLDVGAGYGFLVEMLAKKRRMNSTGQELSEKERGHAHSRGIGLLGQSIEEIAASGMTYDLVSSFEVIEHVAAPKAFLSSLASCVRPGGFLLVMTDNFDCRVARMMGSAFPKWIPHSHISHFGSDSFPNAMRQLSGFRLYSQGSFTPWELWFLALRRAFRGADPGPLRQDLSQALAAERQTRFKAFKLRLWLNPIWARLAWSGTTKGQLMYVALRRDGS